MPISVRHKSELSTAFAFMRGNVDRARQIDFSYIEGAYWSREQIQASNVLRGATASPWNNHRGTLRHRYNVPEDFPVPEGESRERELAFSWHCHAHIVPDTSRGIRPDAPSDLKVAVEGVFNEVAALGMVVGYLRTIEYIYYKVDCHRAMRYLFPHISRVWSYRGDLSPLAEKYATIKSVPDLPTLTKYEINVLRYMHNWFAVQELVGTFEGNKVWYDPRVNPVFICSRNDFGTEEGEEFYIG